MPLDLEGAVELVDVSDALDEWLFGCVDEGLGIGFLSLFFVAIVLYFLGGTKFGTACMWVVF